MTTGLVLGKFAPFHKGHEFMIQTALREVDRLIVLVYGSSLTSVPLKIRAGWIRALYPQVEVVECWDGPEGIGREREVELMHENYILKVLSGRRVDKFFCSEFYGEHVSRALNCEDRRVDMDRSAVPVSGTQIRENPHAFREYVSPLVYRDLVTKVVLVGAMGTGKSTLAEKLAKFYKTEWMPEYGRDYWMEHRIDRRLEHQDLENIVRGHQEREEQITLDADRYLFVDTCALTTYLYSLDYHGRACDYVSQKADEDYRRYDLFLLCQDDIPFDDTWDRSGPQKRENFQKLTTEDLLERRIPFVPLYGSLEGRMKQVHAILKTFQKYGHFFGNAVNGGIT